MSGLFTRKDKGITVNLHLLLPVDLWEFGDEKREVCVCFQHPKMGNGQPVVSLYPIR